MSKTKLWILAAILSFCGATVLTSCSNDDDPVTPPTDEVEAQLQKMTLREKVGQLFYVRPECLDTTIHFNQPSIDFYLSLGAVPMKDWTVYRLDAAALERLSK